MRQKISSNVNLTEARNLKPKKNFFFPSEENSSAKKIRVRLGPHQSQPRVLPSVAAASPQGCVGGVPRRALHFWHARSGSFFFPGANEFFLQKEPRNVSVSTPEAVFKFSRAAPGAVRCV